jgi:uracil permease
MIKILPILLGVVGSYVVALIWYFYEMKYFGKSNILDFTLVSQYASQGVSGFISLPKFTLAKFDVQSIMIMAPIAIATIIELIGNISSISATIGENLFEDPGLERELMGDGLASSISGLFGGPPCTTYGENTSVLELSKVYDTKVVRIAACYAIILSFCPVVAQLIGSVPPAIIGGVSFILYGMISAIGIRNLVENKVDFTNSRNLIIAALILVTGLGFKFWNVQGGDGVTFQIFGTNITLTALALASIVGVVANAILPDNKSE